MRNNVYGTEIVFELGEVTNTGECRLSNTEYAGTVTTGDKVM